MIYLVTIAHICRTFWYLSSTNNLSMKKYKIYTHANVRICECVCGLIGKSYVLTHANCRRYYLISVCRYANWIESHKFPVHE